MRNWLSIILIGAWLACSTAQAAPSVAPEDEFNRFVSQPAPAEVRLLDKLGQVGHTVTNRASDLVITAMGFLGVPYRRGGNTVENGFDCSGFVRAMYEKTIGLVLPRRANEQAAATQSIEKNDLQPGDLVFFNTMRRAFSHVGIYVGEGKFIHSPKPGAQVRVEDMGHSYWQRRFDGARRVVGLSSTAPDSTNP